MNEWSTNPGEVHFMLEKGLGLGINGRLAFEFGEGERRGWRRFVHGGSVGERAKLH